MSEAALICGGPEPEVRDDSGCPRNDEHTPAPRGYIAWHEWAGGQSRLGRRQRKCAGCGRYAVWMPR